MISNTHPLPRTPVRRTRGRPSLLSNTVAVAVFEAWRQNGYDGAA